MFSLSLPIWLLSLSPGYPHPIFPRAAVISGRAWCGHTCGMEKGGQKKAVWAHQSWVSHPELQAPCSGVQLGCDMSLHFWWRQPYASLGQHPHMATQCLSLPWLWSWKHRKKWIIYCWLCYTFWLGTKKCADTFPLHVWAQHWALAWSSLCLLLWRFLTHPPSFRLLKHCVCNQVCLQDRPDS